MEMEVINDRSSFSSLENWITQTLEGARSPEGQADALLRIVEALGERAAAVQMLQALIADDRALRMGADKSYVHYNGFDKLVLSHKPGKYKLRLHIWWNDKPELPSETIHDHRWDFATRMLTGTYLAETFARAESGTESLHEYRYYSPEDDGAFGYQYQGRAFLRSEGTKTVAAGEAYFLDHRVLHRVTQPLPQVTATLVLQGPVVAAYTHSFPFERIETGDKLKIAALHLAPDAVRHRLQRLIAHLEGRTWKEPTARISVGSDVLGRYVGEYRVVGPAHLGGTLLPEDMTIQVESANGHIFVKPKDLPREPAYPVAQDVFSLELVNARLRFDLSAGSGAAKLVVSIGDQDEIVALRSVK